MLMCKIIILQIANSNETYNARVQKRRQGACDGREQVSVVVGLVLWPTEG